MHFYLGKIRILVNMYEIECDFWTTFHRNDVILEAKIKFLSSFSSKNVEFWGEAGMLGEKLAYLNYFCFKFWRLKCSKLFVYKLFDVNSSFSWWKIQTKSILSKFPAKILKTPKILLGINTFKYSLP